MLKWGPGNNAEHSSNPSEADSVVGINAQENVSHFIFIHPNVWLTLMTVAIMNIYIPNINIFVVSLYVGEQLDNVFLVYHVYNQNNRNDQNNVLKLICYT